MNKKKEKRRGVKKKDRGCFLFILLTFTLLKTTDGEKIF